MLSELTQELIPMIMAQLCYPKGGPAMGLFSSPTVVVHRMELQNRPNGKISAIQKSELKQPIIIHPSDGSNMRIRPI
jgi:hypothetical protein